MKHREDGTMRKLMGLALGLVMMTGQPAEAKESKLITVASTYLAATVMCHLEDDRWITLAQAASYQLELPSDVVLELIRIKSQHVIAYVVRNDKLGEFCLQSIVDMYGKR